MQLRGSGSTARLYANKWGISRNQTDGSTPKSGALKSGAFPETGSTPSTGSGLAIDELHFVMEAFGDAVVADEAPHGDDLLAPGRERLAESHQLDVRSVPQKRNHRIRACGSRGD